MSGPSLRPPRSLWCALPRSLSGRVLLLLPLRCLWTLWRGLVLGRLYLWWLGLALNSIPATGLDSKCRSFVVELKLTALSSHKIVDLVEPNGRFVSRLWPQSKVLCG